jgi:hypothetical protein
MRNFNKQLNSNHIFVIMSKYNVFQPCGKMIFVSFLLVFRAL